MEGGDIMPVKKLKAYLDENSVKYSVLKHSRAFTAQEVASSVHIKGKEVAKTVIVKVDGKLSMAVLPASYDVDLKLLKKVTGAKTIEIATEDEFKDLFPECEVGAMPPFGNLYGLDVYVAPGLAEDEHIAFNAGTHTELIQLSYSDFERLVKPIVLIFSTR